MLDSKDAAHNGMPTALVVDDDPNVLVTTGAFLKRAGFSVATTRDTDEAMRFIADNPRIAVLITDFAMPALSGAELVTEARQLRPALKALVMSGYPGAISELPPGIPVIVKPFRRTELIDAVRSLLDERDCGHLSLRMDR